MNLIKAHVTNFRSAEDTGEFDIGQVLCLVGKNEAGKSAVSQALAGLNPHPSVPIVFDLERDYPRRHYTKYETLHPEEQAVVITTRWRVNAEEKKQIAEALGENA